MEQIQEQGAPVTQPAANPTNAEELKAQAAALATKAKELRRMAAGLPRIRKERTIFHAHKYITEQSFRITQAIARAMFEKAKTKNEQVTLSLLWLTGARPAELIELLKEDITVNEDNISFRINTKKTNSDGSKYVLKERLLEFDRPKGMELNIYLEIIAENLKDIQPGARLIPFTTKWIQNLVKRVSLEAIQKQLSPYHYRHSAVTREASANVSESGLMHFKGAKSRESIRQYSHAAPYKINANKGI